MYIVLYVGTILRKAHFASLGFRNCKKDKFCHFSDIYLYFDLKVTEYLFNLSFLVQPATSKLKDSQKINALSSMLC